MAEMASYDPGVGGRASGGSSWSSFAQGAGNLGLGTYTAGASALLGFVGTIMQARQARKAASYNEEVLRRNAQAAAQAEENEAQQRMRNAAILLQDIGILRQAQAEQERHAERQQEAIASSTRAIIGASGLMMTGSPLAVYEHNLRESQRDIMASRYRADLQERALRDQAVMEGYAAEMARYGAGERLRVGAAQGLLARYGGSRQAGAGIASGLARLGTGAARTYAAYEARQGQKGPTLRSSDGSLAELS